MMQAYETRPLVEVLKKAVPNLKAVVIEGDNVTIETYPKGEINLGPIVLDTPELSREIGKMVSALHSKKGPLNREPLNEYEMSLVPWHHVIKPEELYCIPNWRLRVPRYLKRVRGAEVGFDQFGHLVWFK